MAVVVRNAVLDMSTECPGQQIVDCDVDNGLESNVLSSDDLCRFNGLKNTQVKGALKPFSVMFQDMCALIVV